MHLLNADKQFKNVSLKSKKTCLFLQCQTLFIAGPMQDTIYDFWRVVVQFKISTIVNLAIPVENDEVSIYFTVMLCTIIWGNFGPYV